MTSAPPLLQIHAVGLEAGKASDMCTQTILVLYALNVPTHTSCTAPNSSRAQQGEKFTTHSTPEKKGTFSLQTVSEGLAHIQ